MLCDSWTNVSRLGILFYVVLITINFEIKIVSNKLTLIAMYAFISFRTENA